MTPVDVERLISQGLPSAQVRVRSDDGTHFDALIIAAAFTGKRPLARHQMVYAALGERMGSEIHALSLRTLTPDEWRREQAS